MTKILRLCKQQSLLQKHKLKMSQQGLRFLDKLNAIKEKTQLKADQQKVITDAQVTINS